ncbi:immunoglobulin superfamily member 2-like [Cyprinodon tularosa]|uniref:immunoglobulin superfamily member 2-like n=1 Tax=Cyprinodon tularosa TaxID=77115 RepID=UPI0018E1FB7B|nr:immunoglobulin superfamily member 2-like [Cyprinodon tularosa]
MKFSLWRPTLLLFLALSVGCEAKVTTEIQTGPLYRVVGSRLSMFCNASGFSNPNSEKGFEIRTKLTGIPGREMNVISSSDEHFSYNRFMRRIERNDINLIRSGPCSIIFEIKNLLKEDDGEYECTVLDPGSPLIGSYTAKSVVKVIDNSLSVTSSDSPSSLSFTEGEALTLTCHASTNTIQHVHLSLGWYLRKDGAEDAEPIISLDKDFQLTPGQGFEQRYRNKAIRLDKIGEATYTLKIAELELSDQGKIYCQAQEWIQDPDRSWYRIAQKDAEEISLTVKAKVVTDTSSLDVSLSAQNALQEGQVLTLSCRINAQNLATRLFSVAWVWKEYELARIGPTGILTVSEEYSDRERDGELRVTRIGNGHYQLKVQPVKTTDGGSYICRAWSEERSEDGNFQQGAAQNSQPLDITISTPESGLLVKMQNLKQKVSEGEKLSLICKVEGIKGRLSVSWQRKLMQTQSPLFTTIISLSQNGVIEKTEAFVTRKVRVTRPATQSFVFEMDEARPLDSGIYECVVTETQTNGKTQSHSQRANVTVTPIETLVKASLKSREPTVTVGKNLDLMCKVFEIPSMPITLTWSQQTDDSNLNTILVLSNGSISWSGNQHRYQVEVNKQRDSVMYYLKILGASHKEAGTYQCRVSVFLDNVYKKLLPSNPLKVQVNNPESKLALSSKPTIMQRINTDIQIVCKVTSATSQSSLYAVTWDLQQETGSKRILSSDQNALVTFGPEIEESHQQRISMGRTSGPNFELTIRQARMSDKGVYVCNVAEYLQNPLGECYLLSEKNSNTTLDVTEPEAQLSIQNIETVKNISIAEEFSIPCHITQQSSNDSQFQVKWFWQRGTEATPMFTAYRNSTLQVGVEDVAVMYGHPLPGQFNLKVSNTKPRNSGLYFCEVEEWVYSLAYGWRKLAVERSGKMNITVGAEGDAKALAGSECMANTWIAIFAVTVIILLCIITILLVKICKSGKKSDPSLWPERHALKPGPEY